MQRVDNGKIRPGWQKLIYDHGLVYNPTEMPDGTVKSYWREGKFYTFTLPQVERMEKDAVTVFKMVEAAGWYILRHPEILRKMGIPELAWPMIKNSWRREPDWGSVYGRFDFRYDGEQLSLLEFNADTPTSLLESAIAQHYWHTQTGQGTDQWNRIFEALVEAWGRNLLQIKEHLGYKPTVVFVYDETDESGEDYGNILTNEDACRAAGYNTRNMSIQDICYNSEDGRFYESADGPHLDVVFKLYPWEMMVEDDFAEAAFRDMARPGGTIWIEPPYKMLWSNKGILAVLWKLFGTDPEKSQLLLPAYFEDEMPEDWKTYVLKPLLGREGANVRIVKNGEVIVDMEGPYDGPAIVQAFAPLPNFPGFNDKGVHEANHPVLGIWMIDGVPAGLGIRESSGLVTDNLSHFVPHVIDYEDESRLRKWWKYVSRLFASVSRECSRRCDSVRNRNAVRGRAVAHREQDHPVQRQRSAVQQGRHCLHHSTPITGRRSSDRHAPHLQVLHSRRWLWGHRMDVTGRCVGIRRAFVGASGRRLGRAAQSAQYRRAPEGQQGCRGGRGRVLHLRRLRSERFA